MSRFGACILDPSGLRLTAEERAFFAEAAPFGFILFDRNIDTPDQLRALCDELRSAVGRRAPILIDQEGGRVQRLGPPHWRAWPPPLDHVAAAGAGARDAVYLRHRIIAHELHAVGIDVDCAPVVDVAGAQTHPFLRNRCYGTEPGSVAMLGRAAAEGLLAGGVLPVLKHIPGHGRATADSHETLPSAEAGQDALTEVDFAPFHALNDLPLAMTGHVVYPTFDNLPATVSQTMLRLIRDEIGFAGLVMTDDIAMGALQGAPTALARDALAAGCDVVLYCNAGLEDQRAVAEAAGALSNAAQARAESALAARRTPDEVDISALEARLEALTNGRADGD
ncbi:beta-N-acetylhexosaminidase [Roseovarius salis]|uniref:beta-N-acetylhexosaminidase n=1 Tax=Roseovarius salis TaxID=3376063 RepID=UPI0037C9CFFF